LFEAGFGISYEDMLVVKLVRVTHVIRNVIKIYRDNIQYNEMKCSGYLRVCEQCSLENLHSGH